MGGAARPWISASPSASSKAHSQPESKGGSFPWFENKAVNCVPISFRRATMDNAHAGSGNFVRRVIGKSDGDLFAQVIAAAARKPQTAPGNVLRTSDFLAPFFREDFQRQLYVNPTVPSRREIIDMEGNRGLVLSAFCSDWHIQLPVGPRRGGLTPLAREGYEAQAAEALHLRKAEWDESDSSAKLAFEQRLSVGWRLRFAPNADPPEIFGPVEAGNAVFRLLRGWGRRHLNHLENRRPPGMRADQKHLLAGPQPPSKPYATPETVDDQRLGVILKRPASRVQAFGGDRHGQVQPIRSPLVSGYQ